MKENINRTPNPMSHELMHDLSSPHSNFLLFSPPKKLPTFAGASYNPSNAAPENVRPQNPEPVVPPRDPGMNPNNVFGFPSSNNNMYHQVPPHQVPLDYPRLPDNRQAFPASPNSNGGNYPYPYHPQLTPPPNVFGPFRKADFVTTTKSPGLLDQFLYNKSPRNASAINNGSITLTLFSLLLPLIYRIRSELA
jgi:hypothetical protein